MLNAYVCSRYMLFFFSSNQNSKQNRGAVFSHKEDSRAFRQLKVPCFPTLYAGLLLFPAVIVFAKLSTNHRWLLFRRFSPAALFTSYTCLFVILPCFISTARGYFSTLSDKCSCCALKPVNVVVFPAVFSTRCTCFVSSRFLPATNVCSKFSLFNEAICSHIEQLYDYFRVKSKGSLQISTISLKFKYSTTRSPSNPCWKHSPAEIMFYPIWNVNKTE